MERVDPFIYVFVVFVTNVSSISIIWWYTFVLSKQIKMFRFIKGKGNTYTKILEVLGFNIKPTLDLPNSRKTPNTMYLEGFYNILLLGRLHYFPKVWQEIIFIIGGQYFFLIEITSPLEKWFDVITPFA